MLDTISAKRDEIYAAANDAAVAFVAFCLESYKTRHALSGDESARIFCRYGVGDYLLEGYDILHSFGERQILDDIDRFIEVRKQKEAQNAQAFRPDSLPLPGGSRLPQVHSFGDRDMAEITQSNLHLILHWKTAGMAELWAHDLGITPLEALMRLYSTDFYRRLEDESTKLWTNSPEQLYILFREAA